MFGVILWAIVIGAIIGVLGRLVVPGRQNMSIWLTIAVGVVAAILVVRARYFSAAVPSTSAPSVSNPTPAPTQAQARLYVVAVASGQRLNVRAGPSQTAAVLGRLANGTEVREIEGPVEAGGANWLHIEGGGLSGWCVQDGLRPR